MVKIAVYSLQDGDFTEIREAEGVDVTRNADGSFSATVTMSRGEVLITMPDEEAAKLQSQIEAANHAKMKRIATQTRDASRQERAEDLLEQADFGDFTAAAVGGWEIAGDQWTCAVFLVPMNEPERESVKMLFGISFSADETEVSFALPPRPRGPEL